MSLIQTTDGIYEHVPASQARNERWVAEIDLIVNEGTETVDQVMSALAHQAGVTAAINWYIAADRGPGGGWPAVLVTTSTVEAMHQFLRAYNDPAGLNPVQVV